jgi:hypothetical protein
MAAKSFIMSAENFRIAFPVSMKKLPRPESRVLPKSPKPPSTPAASASAKVVLRVSP